MARSDMGSNPAVSPTAEQRRRFATGMRDQGQGYLLNAKPGSFARTRSKIAQVRTGKGNATIAALGDSLFRGTGSGTGTVGDNTQGVNSILWQMRSVFSGRGITANAENAFGYGGWQGATSGNAINGYDSRITLSGSFDRNEYSSVVSFGGLAFSATAAGYLQITSSTAGDTVDIWYLSNGSSFSYQVDGGSATTVNTANDSTIKKATVALGSSATHAVKINWVSGSVYIVGMNFYTAATKRIDLLCGAWHGSQTQQWVTGSTGSFWNYDKAISALGCDLVLFGLGGTNDWGNSVTAAAYKVNLDALVYKITSLSSPPEILLVTAPPEGRSTGLAASQQDYVDAMIEFAFDSNIPVYDRYRSWGGRANSANMETWGALNNDHLHLSNSGYMADAEKLVGCILGR